MASDLFGIVGTVQGGAFRVDEVVAEGGFAVIYRAYHSAFRSDVALKCLKIPRTFTEDEQAEFLERFREEAELLFRLSSAISSVVRPLQVGTLTQTKGRFVPFLALEWLDGETLDQLVSARREEGKPPLEIVPLIKMLTPVADALCRAHKLPTKDGVVSIVHRDLKPENIFLADVAGKKLTKVLDFGIAKVKSAATQVVGKQSATESPLAAFTPAYGGPEQWLPKRYGQTGPWTDVWGLALTLVEGLCGHPPFEGEQAVMMMQAIDPERRPSPRTCGVLVSDRVEAVFLKALAVDPRDRYAEVSVFWNALCEAVGLPQVVGDRRPSLLPPVAEAPMSAVPDLVAPPSGKGPRSGASDQHQLSSASGQHRLSATSGQHRVPPAPVVSAPSSMSGQHKLSPASGSQKQSSMSGQHRLSSTSGQHKISPADAQLGKAFEASDDLGPPLQIETAAPARIRVAAPPSLARPVIARTTSVIVRPGGADRKLALGTPLKLLALAVLMMAGDHLYATATGDPLRVGPARVFWVAGPLAAIGVILLVTRLLGAED